MTIAIAHLAYESYGEQRYPSFAQLGGEEGDGCAISRNKREIFWREGTLFVRKEPEKW